MFNPFKPRPSTPARAPEAADPSRNALVPRIKHLAFERELRGRGIPAEHLPIFEPLIGELLVTYAFDLPEQFVMANPTNMARAGISLDEARALACANLRSRLPELEYVRGPGVSLVVTGGDWEACLLLLNEVWQGTQARFNAGFVVCAPRRDRLLISDGVDAQTIASMRQAADRFFAERDDGHALSVQLMTRLGGQWRLHVQ